MTFLPYKLADSSKCFLFASDQPKGSPSGFVYYLSIPDVIQTMMDCGVSMDKEMVLRNLLDSEVTADLALLLKKNHWSADVTAPLTAVIVKDRAAVPMFASSVVAQTLAFFAFSQHAIQQQENKSVSLLLLTLRTDSLLGGAAPFTNPLGSFWLADVSTLLSLLKDGKAALEVEPFHMSVNNTQSKRLSHSDVRAETKAFGMQKRKAMLEECVSFLTLDLERKKTQLKKIEQKMEERAAAEANETTSGPPPAES
jgi:hypothetical protein